MLHWAVMEPPVVNVRPANSLKVIRNSESDLCCITPSTYSTSSTGASQMAAARSTMRCLISCEALMVAKPVAKVVRLPPVMNV